MKSTIRGTRSCRAFSPDGDRWCSCRRTTVGDICCRCAVSPSRVFLGAILVATLARMPVSGIGRQGSNSCRP